MKNLTSRVMTLLGLLVIGAAAAHGSEQPKMNGKLKIGVLPVEDTCYTGKPYIKELGAYAFNYRNYDPQVARWTTPDPSGFPDGANSNKYVEAPTFSLDPLGLNTIYQRIEKHYITYSPSANNTLNLLNYYRDAASLASSYFSNLSSAVSLNEQVRLALQGVPDNFFNSEDFANALGSPFAGWSESSNEWDYLQWGIKNGPTGPAPDMNKVIPNGEKSERGAVTVRLDRLNESSPFEMKVVEWWTHTVETE